MPGSNACSECSCDNCDHRLEEDGPNQVNYLATTHEAAGDNLRDDLLSNKSLLINDLPKTNMDNSEPSTNELSQQLSRVLGALESTIEDHKHKSEADSSIVLDQSLKVEEESSKVIFSLSNKCNRCV